MTMTMIMTMTGPKLITHVYVLIFSFIGTAMPVAHAQQPSLPPPPPPPDSFPGQYSTSSFTLAMTLTLVFVILVFVVTSLVAICINRFATDSMDQQPVQQPRELRVGLDPSLVEMFPVVDYVGVKGIKIGNGPLECAVCLSEFVDDDKVRLLLPGCCHAFHPDCIDGWLKNHITCPVCRSDLTHNAEIIAIENNLSSENGEQHLAVAAVDRFTLRLPEHVQRDIEASRGEQRMAARIAGHQYEILPASRSGKVWSFLRVFSSRRQPDVEIGEGSVRSIGSIRREGSVRSIAQVANFHSGSLQSGSLRLSSSKEEAEASAGSAVRLSPVPCLTATAANPELAASCNSTPSSPSERHSTDLATVLNRA